jgi:hypothetical protein
MADPLSIAASITGVASTGFALAKGLNQIASSIGSAGEEVRLYGGEVESFCRLLNHVRLEVLNPNGPSVELRTLLSETVQTCDRILDQLKTLLRNLKPLSTRYSCSDRKLQQLGLRLRWIFGTKSRARFYRNALNAQHKLLQTLLDLMILHATRDRSQSNIS